MSEYIPAIRFTHETDLGGLNLYGLRALASLGDGTFRVATLPYPKDDAELATALKVLNHEKVVFAYRDKTKLVFVMVGGFSNWLEPFSKAGINILKAKNWAKQLKAFTRPTEVGFTFFAERDNNIEIIDDVRGFSDEDLSEFDDDQVEGILDGMFVFDRSLTDLMLDSMEPNKDPVKAARQIMRIKNAHGFNVRVVEDRYIKGDALPSKKPLPKGVQFLTSGANIKGAIKSESDGMRLFIAQPHSGSNMAMLSIQENLWLNAVPNGTTQMFTDKMFRIILDDYFERAYQSLISGELTERFSDIESAMYASMKDMDESEVAESFSKIMRWSVVASAMRGFDYRTSPTLIDAVARGFTDGMFDRNGHARIQIPNASFKPIKSVSMLKAAGYKVRVKRGSMRLYKPLDVYVISDHDWVNSHLDFGTHDGDDTWKVWAVNIEGKVYYMTWRLPMDSYVVFEADDEGIPYTWATGETTYSFELNGTIDTLPEPLSVLIKTGKVNLTGLPSANRPKVVEDPRPLAKEDMAEAIRESMNIQPGLGAWVNALFLYRAVFRRMPEKMLSIISDVVDTTDPDDMEMVMSESRKLVEEVLRSGKPIPSAYWNSPWRVKSFNRIAEDLGIKPNLSVNGKLDRQQAMVADAIKKFRDRVRTFAQSNHALVDQSIMALFPAGNRELKQATSLMKAFRISVARANNGLNEQYSEMLLEWRDSGSMGKTPRKPVLTSEQWIVLYAPIMEAIESLPEGDERDRFVLALYVVAHTVPTTRGAFSDNFIMTSMRKDGEFAAPFPYLMQALQNFGYIADDLKVNDKGVLELEYQDMRTWTLTCSCCKAEYLTANPDMPQAFADNGGVCKSCR